MFENVYDKGATVPFLREMPTMLLLQHRLKTLILYFTVCLPKA